MALPRGAEGLWAARFGGTDRDLRFAESAESVVRGAIRPGLVAHRRAVAFAPGGLLPGARRAAASQVRIAGSPRDAGDRGYPAPVAASGRGHRNLSRRADRLLDARGAGRPREELQPAAAAGRPLPARAALRRDVDLARGGRRRQPVVLAQGDAGHDRVGQDAPLPDARREARPFRRHRPALSLRAGRRAARRALHRAYARGDRTGRVGAARGLF